MFSNELQPELQQPSSHQLLPDEQLLPNEQLLSDEQLLPDE